MFDRIRPYRDDEIPAAMERMASDKFLPTVCSYLFPDKTLEEVAAELRSCRTVRDFQSSFGYDVVWAIVLKTIDKLTVSGLEELPDDRKYLFVANHRDIVLDAAILQDLLMNIGRDTTEITFGANLMEGQFVIDFGKSNKMFRVERPDTVASPREFLEKSMELSSYIRYCILEKGESVWIAQRNGRTKDGHDMTDPGIIKMFGMAGDIAELNIVPITVSYEWEPCDSLKAAELAARRSGGTYVKKPGEDLNSILTGLTQPKGRVHFEVGKPLSEKDFAPLRSLPRNAFHREVAALIDRKVHAAYRLWPNNYVAASLMGATVPDGSYSEAEKEAFLAHIGKCAESLRQDMISMYAAPYFDKK